MAEKIERVPSGIRELDKLIAGGFKRNSINLIVGGPGCGKTIFALQFLVEGILKGESTIYVTFEEKKEKLYEDMLTFGWDLAKFEKEGKFVFLEYTPEQIKKVLVEGGGTIDTLITKNKAKRIVIDSITSFSLLYQDELTKKEAALALFEMMAKWGCTAILTSQDESTDSHTVTVAMEFEVDSIILLYNVKVGSLRKRAIEILKMRGTRHSQKTFLMGIGSKGLEIDLQKTVSF